jgi:hypothetical protein
VPRSQGARQIPSLSLRRRNLSRNALLPRQDRENLRNLETQLTIRGHCLQRQTPLAAAKRLSGFEQAPSKPGPSTKPKTSSPSRRSTGDFRTITIIQAIPPAKSAPHTGLETLWYDCGRRLCDKDHARRALEHDPTPFGRSCSNKFLASAKQTLPRAGSIFLLRPVITIYYLERNEKPWRRPT